MEIVQRLISVCKPGSGSADTPWYKNKLILVGAVLFGALLLLGGYFISKSGAQNNDERVIEEPIQLKKEHAQVNAAATGCPRQTGRCPQSYQGQPPPLLLVSLDGFHPDYLKRGLSPFLNRVGRCGTQADFMYPVYPSKTFPNHYSIVTGLNPESHGIIDNNMYDPHTHKVFKFKSPDSNSPIWYQKEPIWVTASKQGKKTASYFWPSSDVKFDGILPTYSKKYSPRISYSTRVDQILEWLQLPADRRPSFLTLYFNQPDNAGHASGINSKRVNEAIQGVDQMIEKLIDGLQAKNLLNCVNVIILSDHGMTDTDCKLVVDINNYIDASKIFSTMGPFGRIRPKGRKDADAVNGLINALRCQSAHMRVYRKEQLPVRMHYTVNDRIEPIILDMDNKWTVVTKGVQGNDGICTNGAHGYDNLFPDMRAIFVAHGPSIKTNNRIKPFIVTELYELMSELIGIVPNPNNGTRGSLHHVLRSPKRISEPAEPASPTLAEIPENAQEQNRRIDAANCICQTKNQVNSADHMTSDVHLPFGVPHSLQDSSTLRLLHNKDYVSAFHLTHRMPAWTSFTLSGERSAPQKSEEVCFRGDARIPASDTSKCNDYQHPSVKKSYLYQRPLFHPGFSADSQNKEEASYVSNSVPKSLNHTNILEAKMNEILAKWVTDSGPVNVVVGPAFNFLANGLKPSLGKILHEKVGPLVVPTHIYVVATWCSVKVDTLSTCLPRNLETRGFLLPNHPFTQNCEDGGSLIKRNMARVVDIENLTGISFFTKLPIYEAIRLRTSVPSPLKTPLAHLPS